MTFVHEIAEVLARSYDSIRSRVEAMVLDRHHHAVGVEPIQSAPGQKSWVHEATEDGTAFGEPVRLLAEGRRQIEFDRPARSFGHQRDLDSKFGRAVHGPTAEPPWIDLKRCDEKTVRQRPRSEAHQKPQHKAPFCGKAQVTRPPHPSTFSSSAST